MLYAKGFQSVLAAGANPYDHADMLVMAMRNASFDGMSGYVKMDPATGNRITDINVMFLDGVTMVISIAIISLRFISNQVVAL